MTTPLLFIIGALCSVCALLLAQVSHYKGLAAHYKQAGAGYQNTWEKAEEWVTILRKLTQLQQEKHDALLHVFAGYFDRLLVLHNHPKLTAKKLRRILQAHLKRQYVSNRTAYSRRIRTRNAALIHNLYSLRADYRETYANKAATPYPGLLPDVMRSRFAQMRSFNKITTPLL